MNDVKKAIETLQAATANCAVGDRHIAVLDRGWIFVGNMSLNKETNVYTLTDCQNVRKWERAGFGGLSKGAKSAGATMDPSSPMKFHASALIFCVPITGEWENE